MARYIPDIASHRWVIIAPNRTDRPEETGTHAQEDVCPFCPGNEQLSAPETFRLGGGEKDGPGWKVRVVPNKFPITDFHEVIVHTPDEHAHLGTMTLPDVELVFTAYRMRYNFYRERGEVMIFCNHGEHAGASITHSHSQLVVTPFQITLDALSREPLTNVVNEHPLFHIYCPDFSQWPYEVWIAPKTENTVFGDTTDKELTELSQITQLMLRRLEEIYKQGAKWLTVPFGYNFYIYSRKNWFLRIIPRFVYRAGFELGTGLSVNVVDPAQAAKELAKTSFTR